MTTDTGERAMRVLLVTRSDAETLIVTGLLRRADASSYAVDRVSSLDEAVEAMRRSRYHVALVDASLEDGDAARIVGRLHRTPTSPPILLLAGCVGEAWARAAVQGGADDVLERGAFDTARLVRAIDAAISRRRRGRFAEDQKRQLDARLADAGARRHALEHALMTVSDGMVMLDRASLDRVIWSNDVATAMLEEVDGDPSRFIDGCEPPESRDALRAALASGSGARASVRQRTASGERRDLVVDVSAADVAGLALVIVRDVTRESRVLRADRARQQTLAAVLEGRPLDHVVRGAASGLDELLDGACHWLTAAQVHDLDDDAPDAPGEDAVVRAVASLVRNARPPAHELVEQPLDVQRGRALRDHGFSRVWMWDTDGDGVLVALRPPRPDWDALDRSLFVQTASLLSLLSRHEDDRHIGTDAPPR